MPVTVAVDGEIVDGTCIAVLAAFPSVVGTRLAPGRAWGVVSFVTKGSLWLVSHMQTVGPHLLLAVIICRAAGGIEESTAWACYQVKRGQ